MRLPAASLLLVVVTSLVTAQIRFRRDDDRNVYWSADEYHNHKFFDDFQVVTPEKIRAKDDDLKVKRDIRGSTSIPRCYNEYKLNGYGEDFQLCLNPNNNFLAPGFTVLRRRADVNNGSVHIEMDQSGEGCFFVGHLANHNRSSVAISSCGGGLMGLIRTETHDYLLEPLPESLHPHEPHILYKRSLDKMSDPPFTSQTARPRQTHFCGARKKFMPHREKSLDILPGEYDDQVTSRFKRSLTPKLKDRKVETLVVVDRDMVDAHGVDNITTYVLTIFNMVATLYNDGTIGNNISVVLVALLLLEGEEPGLVLTNNAERSLHSFCQWQSALRYTHGFHHDHAILLTGLDICSWKNEPCDTLGYAPISGMCSKYRSCTINEDTGLALAFTIAHESGHNFGMVHDGDGNICRNTKGSIMAPTLTGLDGTFSWSSCSRKDLNKFLSSAQSLCLENEPKLMGEFKFPSTLPGELYDADMQCRWQFGRKSKLCVFEFGKDICQSLWCQKSGRQCETKFLPAAEGTSCGSHKWCRRGVCVDYGHKGPSPVDGQWTAWQDWSVCSRTCGGGVTYQERECNNPRPQFGGKFCHGESRRYKMCNIQSCPSNSVDFRAEQCASFNSRPFRGAYYHWVPYSKGLSDHVRCKLYCMPQGLEFFFAMSSKVVDGTPCRSDSSNICIDGECKEVGCDYVIGSGSHLDACGICNGDNSTCTFIRGNYTDQPLNNNYYPVVIIPIGARSIYIREMSMSASYLAIRNSSGYYYLTGDWTVDWPGRYRVGQTVFHYRRPYNSPETLMAEGPLDQEVVIELLLQGINPGVAFEYTLPTEINLKHPRNHFHPYHYSWRALVSDCSVSCAGGEMVKTVQCFRNDNEQVDFLFCDKSTKPEEGVTRCNGQSCPPRWSVAEWTPCSRPCGEGRQKRKVRCVVKVNSTQEINVKAKLCSYEPRPERKRQCNNNECPPSWHVTPWTTCSVTCGGGIQMRNVTCRQRKTIILLNKMCKQSEQPRGTRACNKKRCRKERSMGRWVTTTWSQCSQSCGGERVRLVRCVPRDRKATLVTCNGLTQPKEIESCNNLCPQLSDAIIGNSDSTRII